LPPLVLLPLLVLVHGFSPSHAATVGAAGRPPDCKRMLGCRDATQKCARPSSEGVRCPKQHFGKEPEIPMHHASFGKSERGAAWQFKRLRPLCDCVVVNEHVPEL